MNHARNCIHWTTRYAAVVVGLCMICLQAYSEVSSQGTVNVNINVQAFLELNVTDASGIVMTTVTSDWFGRTRTSQGSVGVEIRTNYAGTLRCLDTVVLEFEGVNYSVPVGVMLSGVSSAYYSGDYICLDFDPGVYLGGNAATLSTSLTKLWSWQDAPGTYQGTVVLEFVPR